MAEGETSGFFRKDGPYSWVIFFVIVANSTMVGLMYTILGVMTYEYPILLGIPQSQANLVGSVMLGIFLFTVPINTILVSNVNLRVCAGIGSACAIIGVFSSAFVSQLWHLLLGFALCGGYGVSLLWTASIKIVPHYFKKRQKMAYMATGVGYGIGRAVFPYIITSIFKVTNYKETMLYTVIFYAISISAPIAYKEQLPKARPDSAVALFKAYTHPLKRYIVPFHLLNGYLWNAELTGVAVILFTYIEHNTASTSIATTVQTINGAMQLTGAIGLTLLLLKVKLNHYILQIVFNLLIGVVCFVIGAYRNEYSFYVAAGVLGFMEAIMVGNITCVCHHLYPEKDVVYAFGFHEAVGGIAGFLAPFTAGLIQDKFGQDAGFYYLGCNSVLGGLIYILAGIIRKSTWAHRPENKLEDATPSDTEASQISDKKSIGTEEDGDAQSSIEGVGTEKLEITMADGATAETFTNEAYEKSDAEQSAL
ncbi:monocarboxylate transporter 8-like [Watersipora subatra]|uniref:monocarboxylate transporter 8-like n=1 Tax=Watersipora subatra TaxID=2589382 RepID=UPI00355BCCF9